MSRAKIWFGVFAVSVPFAFAGCGDDAEDDDGGDGGHEHGGTSGSGTGGTTGGSSTGGKGGSSGSSGSSGSNTGGNAGTSTGGNAGTGGAGGEGGGDGGEGGDGEGGMGPQGGTAGMNMGGAGGAIAGGGAGGKAGGGAGGAVAGGGAGGKAGGGAGGAVAGGGAGGKAGGGAGGAAGGGGTGGVAATCDPNPPPEIYVGVLSGANERPTPVTTTATGFVVAELNAAGTELTSTVRWSGLTTDLTNGHIHGPAGVDATASPIFYYFGVGNPAPNLPPTPPPSTTGSVVAMTFPIDATQLGYLRTGQLYANIHSVTNGSGEIRAQLVRATVFRSGTMSGAQEVPFVSSPATGRGVVAVFPDGIHASVSFSWSGLTAVKTNGHVHGPAPIGVGPVGVIFPLLPTAGATAGSLPHQIWTFAGSDSANLLGNLTYANVHSMNFTAGEIRGQLLPPCPI